jgi:hypothetical protein
VLCFCRYISKLSDIITPRDWYDPKTKTYDEDLFEDIYGIKGQAAADSSTAILHTKKSQLLKSAGGATNVLQKKVGTTQEGVGGAEEDRGPNPVLIVDGGNFDRRGKRNPPRTSTGRIAEPMIIDGNALGVRKSLSIEELSRETLVAANPVRDGSPSPTKSYSLRMHCRIPYK